MLTDIEYAAECERMRAASGRVSGSDRLQHFVYVLVRDVVTPGRLEELVDNLPDGGGDFTNGWLALYAKDVAERLRRG